MNSTGRPGLWTLIVKMLSGWGITATISQKTKFSSTHHIKSNPAPSSVSKYTLKILRTSSIT